MTTLQNKIQISAFSALIFAIVNSHQAYNVTNKIFKNKLYNNITECSTNNGKVLHTIIFFVLILLSMGNLTDKTGIKIKRAIYGTLIYYLVSSAAFFSLIKFVFGSKILNNEGCPSSFGVGISSIIYCLFLIGVMYLPEN
jgi:hypothetical protein